MDRRGDGELTQGEAESESRQEQYKHFGPGYLPWHAPPELEVPPLPFQGARAMDAHAWLKRIRGLAVQKFSGVRHAGVVIGLLFGGLAALINYNQAEPPVPLSAWAWDLTCGILIAILWRWVGWRPFLKLREDCRAHIRGVLEDTGMLAQVLSLEPSAGQPGLWRLVLGSAVNYHPGKPQSFQRRIRAFLKHYAKFARQEQRRPYPVSLQWAGLITYFLGPVVLIHTSISISLMLLALMEYIEPEPRLAIVSAALYTTSLLSMHALPELRRSAVELAVTDVLLGEGE